MIMGDSRSGVSVWCVFMDDRDSENPPLLFEILLTEDEAIREVESQNNALVEVYGDSPKFYCEEWPVKELPISKRN